jgi:hypothetical protein
MGQQALFQSLVASFRIGACLLSRLLVELAHERSTS